MRRPAVQPAGSARPAGWGLVRRWSDPILRAPPFGRPESGEDLLRDRRPRFGGLLAEVPERRCLPQGGRPDHGRRHDREGHGPDRRDRGRLGAQSPGAAPRAVHRGRAARDGEADLRSRLLPGPPHPGRARCLVGRPDPRRRAVQGRDPAQRGALDGPRRRAPGEHRDPLRRLAGQRRHVRDRPDHRPRGAGRPRRGQHDRPRRAVAGLDRLGEPDALEHVPRDAGARAASPHRRARREGAGSRSRDLQFPRPAVRLEP